MPKDSPRLKWSLNEVTLQPTITRKENYANGRWNETPPKSMLPKPPAHWLTPKSGSVLTETKTNLKPTDCCNEVDDDDSSSVTSGLDSIKSGDFVTQLYQDEYSGVSSLTESTSFESGDKLLASILQNVEDETSSQSSVEFGFNTGENVLQSILNSLEETMLPQKEQDEMSFMFSNLEC